MLEFDTNTSPPTLTNISVPSYIGPGMNGAIVHLPVGEQGVLVQIAGQTTTAGISIPFGVSITEANAGNTNINNSFVDIYDIQTGFWFRQQTFGWVQSRSWEIAHSPRYRCARYSDWAI